MVAAAAEAGPSREGQRSVEALFKQWAEIAQGAEAKSRLKEQADVLESLRRRIASDQFHTAPTTHNVLRGVVMSTFGLAQISGQSATETESLHEGYSRIQGLMVLVALESLPLAHLLSGEGNEDAQTDAVYETSVLRSHDQVISITLFLNQASEYLVDQPAQSPIAISLLAWAIVLNSLPQGLHPPQTGFEGPVYQEFAKRALSQNGNALGWLDSLVGGPAVSADESTEDDGARQTQRRPIIKDLLMGLVSLVNVEQLGNREQLHSLWQSLFSTGSPSQCHDLCEDYWLSDARFPARTAVLDLANFPHSFELPALLASLTGSGQSEPIPNTDDGTHPAESAVQYLSTLQNVTLPLDSLGGFKAIGKDALDRLAIVTAKSIILPGGATIPSGVKGIVISAEDAPVRIVRLSTPPTLGWDLLIEVLRAKAGQRPMDYRDGANSLHGDWIYLSVADLGITSSTEDVLQSSFQLLRAVLHPRLKLAVPVLDKIGSKMEQSCILVFELVLAILGLFRGNDLDTSHAEIITSGFDIFRHILALQQTELWNALRRSFFFGALGKKRSIAADLIHADSARGEHTVTISLLTLVSSIVSYNSHTSPTDQLITKAAIKLIFETVWLQAPGWRYRDVAKKYQVISLIASIFNSVLAHPQDYASEQLSEPAQYLIDVLLTSATTMTYRPVTDIISQAVPLAIKLVSDGRSADAILVVESLESTLSLTSTLLRLAAGLSAQAQSLPKSLFASSVATAIGKLQLVDYLLDLSVDAALPPDTRIAVLSSVRTYLEATANDSPRPSLAALLRNPQKSMIALAGLLNGDDSDVACAVWNVLTSIITSQPGCALAAIGQSSDNGDKIPSTLGIAVEQVVHWDDVLSKSSQLLAAVLAFCNAVLASPSAGKAVEYLQKEDKFWPSVYEVATRPIPPPPTFALSLHSEDFAPRVKDFAYSIQTKANATSLLAAELANLIAREEDAPETKVQRLLLGLFRNGSSLTEAAASACHSDCQPSLHAQQAKVLEELGVKVDGLRSLSLAAEREYGRGYLYDGTPIVAGNEYGQSRVNLALDALNTGWSMLDADIALTRSFRNLTERLSSWTEGDGLAAQASLKASVAVAMLLAEEDRGGDIMLAIQAERLEILATLLETALDQPAEVDAAQMSDLCISVRKILESQLFPPMIGLRHPELPALHQPILRIIFLLFQALPLAQGIKVDLDPTLEAATTFTLEAGDVVLDTLIRQSENNESASVDLGAIVGVLCEVTKNPNTAIWLDKIAEHDLINRSFEIITRAQITQGRVPRQVTSILFLHLALASNPLSAEKVAISGLLPAYSDNNIAMQAELGAIEPLMSTPTPHSLHGAWCSMLLVVKALLTSLPAQQVKSYARSDIVPFIRVCTKQFLKTFGWDGETSLTTPLTQELQLSCDVIYGISRAIGPNDGLFDDFSPSGLELLKTMRYTFAHPRHLSGLFVPSSEEEKEALEKELAKITESSDPQIMDFKATPTVAKRTTALASIARTVVMTLVEMTSAWEIIGLDEGLAEGIVIEADWEVSATADDPIGILNDLISTTTAALTRLPLSTREPDVLAARQVLTQLQESSAVLATSQLLVQAARLHINRPLFEEKMDVDTDHKPRRSISGSSSEDEKRRLQLRDLASDLKGMLPDGEDGQRGLLFRLRWKIEEFIEVE